VADLISQGKCLFYEQPDEDNVVVRNLLVIRKQLKREEHRLRIRIRKHVTRHFQPTANRCAWRTSL